MNLSGTQVNDLAKSLVSIMIQFYENPKNEEDFKKWLLNVEKQRESTGTDTLKSMDV